MDYKLLYFEYFLRFVKLKARVNVRIYHDYGFPFHSEKKEKVYTWETLWFLLDLYRVLRKKTEKKVI